MIGRMSKELQRQLSQVEAQKPHPNQTASERAANARTLATLQRMMAQLARQHKDNAGARANDLENNANYKDAVISRLSRLITSITEDGVPGPTERK